MFYMYQSKVLQANIIVILLKTKYKIHIRETSTTIHIDKRTEMKHKIPIR